MVQEILVANVFVEQNNVPEIISIEENFKAIYIKVKCRSIKSPSLDELTSAISIISSRDRIRISIKHLEDQDTLVNYSTGDCLEEFLEDIDTYIDNEDGDEYILSLDIVKGNSNNIVSVYNLERFEVYINTLSLKEILHEFDNLLVDNKLGIDIINSSGISSKSSSINIKSNCVNLEEDTVRMDMIANRMEICNFIDASNYRLAYTDFNFEGTISNKLDEVFKKLKYILSLISISDKSEIIEENKIRYSIFGYKTRSFEIDYSNIGKNQKLEQFADICEWVYKENSGDLFDKIGIVRNIISISLEGTDIHAIESGLLSSIKSSHEIYLKENVERYLDVKKEINNSLFDMMKSVSTVADTVGNRFRTNVAGIVTFFVTIIITNSLSDNKIHNIFTKDITLISISFIIISIAYMLISRHEANVELKRYKILYERLKLNYKGILFEDDIKKIFHEDKYLKEDIEYMRGKIKSSTIIWGVVVVIFMILIFLLGDFKFEYIKDPICNFINSLK